MVHSKPVFAIAFVLLLITITCISQRLPSGRSDSLVQEAASLMYSDYEASDSLFREAEKALVALGIASDPLRWINLNHQRAASSFYNGRFSSAKAYIDEAYVAIENFRSRLQDPDSLIYETVFLQALYLREISQHDLALEKLNHIETYLETQPESRENCSRLYQVVQYQASIFASKGEYESAINGYLSSIAYYDCYRDRRDHPNYVLTFRNIGEVFARMNESENALKYYWKAKSNLKACLVKLSQPRVRTHAMILYHSIGEFYSDHENIDSARYYYSLALPYLEANPVFAYRIYKALAGISLHEKDYASSDKLFQRALDVIRERYGEKNFMTSDIYAQISQLKEADGKLENALAFIQKALNSLTSSTKWDYTDPRLNPPLENSLLKKALTGTLHQKASLQHHAYAVTGDDQYLTGARETNLLAIQLLDSMRNEFTLEKDKVVLGEQAVRIFQTSIQIAYELYDRTADPKYIAEVFTLMDKSKSAVLLDHFKLVRNFSGIPPEVIERERQLKAELSIAEEDLFKAESGQQDPARFREALGDLKRDYADLFSEIKQSWPAYYNLRIANNAVSLYDVQTKLLQPGQAVIEYFPGDTALYMVCVTRDSASMHIANASSLREDILGLREAIMQPDADNRLLRRSANDLFEKLISPWISSLDTTIQSLIVIPQGALTYLPVEMLYPSGSSSTFMLDRFAVSYASSASLLREQTLMKVSGDAFAGFNADYSGYGSLPPLMGSLREIESISAIFGGSSDVFVNATADDFRQVAPGYKVLHLALHSFIDDEKPLFSRLVFTGSAEGQSEITANELYAMELNADLAVLSACESGIGQLHRGEGMMSLSRAFMYAGVPSTLFSLWKVPDQATSRLMTKFYTFLDKGQSRDVALSNAKREFVRDYPEMSAPLFWAGFVINGKTAPLTLGPPFLSPLVIVVIVLIIMAIVLTIYISKRNLSKQGVR